MADGLERRVSLRLFPSNPRSDGEVVEIPVTHGVKLAIHAKNTRHRGDVLFTPQGDVVFAHNIAKVRPAPEQEMRFEFVESDGLDDEGAPDRRRTVRVQPGGVAGLWPQETKTDRIMHSGRRFLRLEVASVLAEGE